MAQSNRDKKNESKGSSLSERGPKLSFWIFLAIFAALSVHLLTDWGGGASRDIDYSTFIDRVRQGQVSSVEVVNNTRIEGTYTQEAVESGRVEVPEPEDNLLGEVSGEERRRFTSTKPEDDNLSELLRNHNDTARAAGQPEVAYSASQEENWFGGLLIWVLPILLLVGLWIFMMRRMSPGSQVLNIGKSKAKLFDAADDHEVDFDDVAGLEEAKEEVVEVVDFLKSPERFTKLGGKLPKGVLLVGPPGTGKTLLAKAVAGEAGVPFFSISGSDFVEMFVGVGASRVRDLFQKAKEKAPCIIFIDEMDAIGRSRGRNSMVGGNDERENTLNQLLVEMDGFDSNNGVIIMAATNRPDVLDKALLRPGRFDRQIMVDKPDRREREQIFEVHTREILIADDVNLGFLASQTPGFAGAEIANVCNEAALLAARDNKDAIHMVDFEKAIDRVIGGLEKKNKLISPEEKKTIAYHEAGHAISGWFLKHTDPVVKVSIVPRGLAALGYAQYMPEERYLYSTEALLDRMTMTIGGRVAEEIVFGEITTGAQNDLERITKMAYAMVVDYGMSEKVGYLSFNLSGDDEQPRFDKPYSDDTARLIDTEVQALIADVRERARTLLEGKRGKLDELADTLLEKEVIGPKELVEILGPRPFGDYVSLNGEDSSSEETGIDAEGEPARPPAETPPPDAPAASEEQTGDGLPEGRVTPGAGGGSA